MSAIVYLMLAGGAGWAAARVTRASAPYAPVVAALAGVIGAVLLALPLGDLGPRLFAVALLPAAVGALAGAGVAALALRRLAGENGRAGAGRG